MPLLPDGRPITAAFIVLAGVSSAAFNVFGASQVYAGLAGLIFAFCILCFEVLAILVLRHIVTDWDNNNYLKASFGSVIFLGVVCVCAMSGKHAFHILTIDVEQTYAANLAKIDRMQSVADDYFATANAESSTQERNRLLSSAEIQQGKVDRLTIENEKNAPPAELVIYLFLAIFELVKSTGRFALAVESTKKWSWRRRKLQALKERAEISEAKKALSNVTELPKAA